MIFLLRLLFVFVVGLLAVLFLRLLLPLPDISNRPRSSALPVDPETSLGRRMIDAMAPRPGRSGVLPLENGQDALASRLRLAAAAERSIDLQYYIWHDDISGILLLGALREAAARGVRVRLLLDDNGIPGLDGMLSALNAEPNFEVRLFNPSVVRRPKSMGYLMDFMRMNRRMHNKSFIADGAAAVLGGRNIGDEYFELGEDAFYVDMDVLVTGPVVAETAKVFDDYWNCASVFELERIVRRPSTVAGFEARLAEVRASAGAEALLGNMQSSAARYAEGLALMEWTTVALVADDPVKGQGLARRGQRMIVRLRKVLGETSERLDLISAYFVPGKQGTEFFAGLARSGRQVRILTNALDTTDVLLVHAGYTRYRRGLLKAGVELFELKLRGASTEKDLQIKPLGLSGASLHAKTFAVDGKRVFVGSFNFDPRSALLNCEMGVVIDSPGMAEDVHDLFDGPLAMVCYRPELTPEGGMVWTEAMGDAPPVIYRKEPGTGWRDQAAIAVIGRVPVEWML